MFAFGRAEPSQIAGPPRSAIPLAVMALLLAVLWRLPPNVPYVSYAFAGSAAIFFGSAPSRRSLFLAAAGIPLFSLLYYGLHLRDVPVGWTSAISTGAGSAAIGASAILAVIAQTPAGAFRRLAAVASMPAFVIVSATVLNHVAVWHPLTFDSTLSAVDQSFGFDPSFAVGKWLAYSSALSWTSNVVYDSLPLALCLVATARLRRFGDDDPADVLASVLIAAGMALFLFQFLPACGPRFLWGSRFPFDPPTHDRIELGRVAVAPGEFRNALPSLHMAGALMVAWAARPLRLHWRFLAWTYVAFTVVGTLGSGQHYLIDLIVAAPFALGVELTVRRRGMVGSTSLLFAIVGLWLIAIRWFSSILVAMPGLTIGASAATIIAVAWLLPQLESLGVRPVLQAEDSSSAGEASVHAEQNAALL
jgi:hypothetical protein